MDISDVDFVHFSLWRNDKLKILKKTVLREAFWPESSKVQGA